VSCTVSTASDNQSNIQRLWVLFHSRKRNVAWAFPLVHAGRPLKIVLVFQLRIRTTSAAIRLYVNTGLTLLWVEVFVPSHRK